MTPCKRSVELRNFSEANQIVYRGKNELRKGDLSDNGKKIEYYHFSNVRIPMGFLHENVTLLYVDNLGKTILNTFNVPPNVKTLMINNVDHRYYNLDTKLFETLEKIYVRDIGGSNLCRTWREEIKNNNVISGRIYFSTSHFTYNNNPSLKKIPHGANKVLQIPGSVDMYIFTDEPSSTSIGEITKI